MKKREVIEVAALALAGIEKWDDLVLPPTNQLTPHLFRQGMADHFRKEAEKVLVALSKISGPRAA